MSESAHRFDAEKRGFSLRQWSLLLASFFLGIACVFAVDRLILSEQPFGVVQAATTAP